MVSMVRVFSFAIVLAMVSILAHTPPAQAQGLCPVGPESPPRPYWSEAAPPLGSGYPDYQNINDNFQTLGNIRLLASLLTRAALGLPGLQTQVTNPEMEGKCVCCLTNACLGNVPEIHTGVKRRDCSVAAATCTVRETPAFPIWLPTDIFTNPNNTQRFYLDHIALLDDIVTVINTVQLALAGIGTSIKGLNDLLNQYTEWVNVLTEGFHLGGYSVERPDLHLCIGYGGDDASADMVNLFGVVTIGGRYHSANLSRVHRSQFRSGGFGCRAWDHEINLVPGIEGNIQIDGFRWWDAQLPFGIYLDGVGVPATQTCPDGDGFDISIANNVFDQYDIFHLVDRSTVAGFDSSGDGCIQPGEFILHDFYPVDYTSASNGQPYVWPRVAYPYDWEAPSTAVFSVGLNLPLEFETLEKLVPPSGIPLFPGATLFPKLTLASGLDWNHRAYGLRKRLQDAINEHLPPSAQLGADDFDRPNDLVTTYHHFQAPDVTEDNGNGAHVDPGIGATLNLGLAISQIATLGINASVGLRVQVKPAAYGGLFDLNVALANALHDSNPPQTQPCDPTIVTNAVSECSSASLYERCVGDGTLSDGIKGGICVAGIHAGMPCDADTITAIGERTSRDCGPAVNVDYDCSVGGVSAQRCDGGANDGNPCTVNSQCPGGTCVTVYGCESHGTCTSVDSGPDGIQGSADDVVTQTQGQTAATCTSAKVCREPSPNAGDPCTEDADCGVAYNLCASGPNVGASCTNDADCGGAPGTCQAYPATCDPVDPVRYFAPYTCTTHVESTITGWQGPGCHPLTVGFPSACGCASSSDCVGSETCVDGFCNNGVPVVCTCDPGGCPTGRVCREGACMVDCSSQACPANETCISGACVNAFGIPYTEQIVWQMTHGPNPRHSVGTYALSDITTSAILDAGITFGIDIKIFRKLKHFHLFTLTDSWPLAAFTKSWYQTGLEAQYQHDCDPVSGDTVTNWQPPLITRYNPQNATTGSYGNAGTIGELKGWCAERLPVDVGEPAAPTTGDLTQGTTDIVQWGEDIGVDLWAQANLCIDGQPFTEWFSVLGNDPAALDCQYTYNSVTYIFPCGDVAKQLMLIWGCLSTSTSPSLANHFNGTNDPLDITTTFNGNPVFDLSAMLQDPTAEFELFNVKPAIRSYGITTGFSWYFAVQQCFEVHYAALQPDDPHVVLGVGPCCGDGVLENSGCAQGPGIPPCEECDDGNLISGDGCSSTCQSESEAPIGVCGDGVVDLMAGEECDDHNLVSGDGCDANCRTTRCGNGIVTAGEQCDDGNLIDVDGCSSTCQVEPGRGCGAEPLTGCRQPVTSAKSSVQLANKTPDSKDQLKWKWLRGAHTTTAEFGDPTTSTTYQLCLYDSTGLRISAHAPAGGVCHGTACWKATGTGFKYKDKDLTPDGIQQIQLHGGLDGKAKIQVVGKGAALGMPNLALLTQPVTVQIQNSNGLCWEAIYSTPPITQSSTQFKDKAD